MFSTNKNTQLTCLCFSPVKLFHFIIASLKSGRSSYLLDVLVGLLYPVVSLQVDKVECLIMVIGFNSYA